MVRRRSAATPVEYRAAAPAPRARTFRLEGWTAGTSPSPWPRSDEMTKRRGRAVTLAVRNPTNHPQLVHVHGHHFRLLDRLDDGWKPYWLDTLVVGEQVERIAFVADNPGKWLIRSRRLEAAAADTAVWFAVS